MRRPQVIVDELFLEEERQRNTDRVVRVALACRLEPWDLQFPHPRPTPIADELRRRALRQGTR